MAAKKLKESDVTYTLACEPEDMPVRGNAMASGDDDVDREAEDDIRNQLDDGNQWAWCQVVLTGRYKGLTAHASLGGCSYKDEADFTAPGGYYDDMKQEVLEQLQAQLDELTAI